MRTPPKKLIAVYLNEDQLEWLDSNKGLASRAALIRLALDEKIKKVN